MNGGLEDGFSINEYGIFAKTADSAETLIFYGCLGDHPQWVSPYSPGVAPDVRDFPATIRISSEAQVRIDYHADAFITAEEAADLLRAAARDEDALLSRFPRLAAVPPRERPAEIRRTFRFAWFPFSPLTGEAGACIAAIDTAAAVSSASYAVRPAGEAAAVLPVPGP